jgi:AraC-like DNA-binding protein
VTSNDLSSTIRFPAKQKIHYVVVAITPAYLNSILALRHSNSVLQTMTQGGNSFLYFENMTVEIRRLLSHMAEMKVNDTLNHFYMQIKVQELLYLLLQKLAARENITHQSVTNDDARRLLHIRTELIRDLSVPPVLKDLAQHAAMSETKLKQLFKQTFGSSIYNYYQQARMDEAAFLLRQGKLAVAEVGYSLGFSNLSHFSRLFEKHYGMSPKKFSRSSGAV